MNFMMGCLIRKIINEVESWAGVCLSLSPPAPLLSIAESISCDVPTLILFNNLRMKLAPVSYEDTTELFLVARLFRIGQNNFSLDISASFVTIKAVDVDIFLSNNFILNLAF